MRVGDVDVLPVFDGIGREVAANILTRPDVDDPWACHPGVLDEHGHLDFDLGGFLVRSGDRTMLVDTGVGDIQSKVLGHGGRYTGGRFLNSLRSHGVEPEDVTDVLLTHLHFDHVGWATQRGNVVFPNATYRVHQADWAHFVDSPDASPGAVRKLTPLLNQLEPFEQDRTLGPAVDALHTPGHTPGSTVYVVSSRGERALMLGDAVHSVVELEERDWQAIFDVDPVAASAARNAIADDVADTEDLLVGAHFPNLLFGRVVTVSGRREFRAL